MFGLRPWFAFLVRALCFFFWVRLDMGATLPVAGRGLQPAPHTLWRPCVRPSPGPVRRRGSGEHVDAEDRPTPDRDRPAGAADGRVRSPGPLDVVLAGLLAAAGIVHLVMVPAHGGDGVWLDPLAFALVGWAQIGLSVVFLLGRGTPSLAAASGALNAVVVGMWTASVTVGLSVGSHAGEVESVDALGAVTAGLEVAAVLVALLIVFAPRVARPGLVVPSVVAVAALGLATTAIVAPGGSGAGGHSHGDAGDPHGAAAHSAEMAAIDATRCDLGFNPVSYWTDAARMGVDTYAGGAMGAHAATTPLGVVMAPDPDQGRGSEGLDRLVSATSAAATGELAAAALVVELAEASEEDRQAWMDWSGRTAAAGGGGHHGHDASAPDDNGGHGGHAGPQPWTAMIDQEECSRLAEELALARGTALRYPTAADAVAGGWVRVTPYVPGIAAHYMKFPLVDGRFEITQPEMLLYDGNGPDAKMVGLSYYLRHSGDAEPTQGFTGPNDHYHRHVGLCNGPGGVIGDSTMTAEECAAIGGRKSDRQDGWMAHAWVVPGCESPWGVFSGASPLLDRALADASGTDGGACAGSSVRDQYDLRPGGRQAPTVGESASGD